MNPMKAMNPLKATLFDCMPARRKISRASEFKRRSLWIRVFKVEVTCARSSVGVSEITIVNDLEPSA